MRALMLSSCFIAAGLIGDTASFAQAQENAFCLESPPGSKNCIYDSLDQCQQVLGGGSAGGSCVANPARSGTTGQSGMSPNPNPNNQPAERMERRLTPSR